MQLPKVGQALKAGEVCGEIESTKSVSEIYSPLTGEVTAVNTNLDGAPEVINSGQLVIQGGNIALRHSRS